MSCLFDSLTFFLNKLNHNITPDQLRSIICDYLLTNYQLIENIPSHDIIQWETDMDILDYISQMRKSSIWGGAIEIKAFCDIFIYEVNIHHNGVVINFIPNKTPLLTINLNYNGSHYTPSI
jgi:hypothetical protein